MFINDSDRKTRNFLKTNLADKLIADIVYNLNNEEDKDLIDIFSKQLNYYEDNI